MWHKLEWYQKKRVWFVADLSDFGRLQTSSSKVQRNEAANCEGLRNLHATLGRKLLLDINSEVSCDSRSLKARSMVSNEVLKMGGGPQSGFLLCAVFPLDR